MRPPPGASIASTIVAPKHFALPISWRGLGANQSRFLLVRSCGYQYLRQNGSNNFGAAHRGIWTAQLSPPTKQRKSNEHSTLTRPALNGTPNRGSQPARPADIPELTRWLLSVPDPTAPQLNHPSEDFEQVLSNARKSRSLLRMLQLSASEARKMFILPPELLKDVHSAIVHFSQKDNSQGMALPVHERPVQESKEFREGGGALESARSSSEGEIFARRDQKVPGPILCTRLLELIGIPHHYRHLSSSSSSSPTIFVHSSQIDLVLECCLETACALSRSCETGKFSLIGTSFNLQHSMPATAEEIWRNVWNMQIKYTSGKRNLSHFPIRIGRIGSIGLGYNRAADAAEFISDVRDKARGGVKDGGHGYNDYLSDTMWGGMKSVSDVGVAWSPKDQRRYGRSVMLFNSVLAAYAKLSSSASGLRLQVRRDMVQSAERLLLEVASKIRTDELPEPSPSTILQCLTPDAVSFNTTMKAWCDYSPRETRKRNNLGDVDPRYMTAAAAERTESILAMMQDLWDEERSSRTTLQSMQTAWDDRRDNLRGHAPMLKGRAIAPNESSYNTVIRAWSRSSGPKAAVQTLRVYQTMIGRGNNASLARDTLMREKLDPAERIAGDAACPDSRTFVALMQSLRNLPSLMCFPDAVDTVESIFISTKQWDEQLHWSIKNSIAPMTCLNDKGKLKPIMNVFSYNTLIKTLSELPTTWEENYHCCLRINAIVESMVRTTQCLPNAITAWSKCAERAGNDKERTKLCAENAAVHVDALLTGLARESNHSSFPSSLIQAINNAIALYGSAGLTAKADELFLRARDCSTHNLGTLSAIIDALCENSFDDIALVEKAHRYLLDFEQEKMRISHSFVIPDMKYTSMYNSVIAGYLNCDMKKRGLEHAQDVLTHMVSSHESNPRHIARPNTTSFARVMSALAQRGDNTQRLEELLDKMEALHQRNKGVPETSRDKEFVANVAPNLVIYNILLKAYTRSNCEKALQSAMKLLGRIEKDPDSQPDDISNSYIMNLLRRKGGANLIGVSSSGGLKDILASPSLTKLDIDNFNLNDLNLNDQSLDLTSKSLNSLMNIYATTGTLEGAENADALLQKLEAMYSSGEISFRPDIFLYNKLMNAWSLCEQNSNDPSFSPAEKAQKILDSICERRKAGGEGGLTPNDVSFSICIHAWCKSNLPDAAKRAEYILRRKEVFAKKYSGVQIKSTDYNSVISKWKDDPVQGPERAELLFEEMLLKYGGPENREGPTAATLNVLLNVYAKYYQRNLAEKAENLLNRMNQMHQEGKGCILPDAISYRSVIDAWIRLWHKDSPQKVEALVKEMFYRYKNEGRNDLCPDSNAFNLVLKACSHAPAMWQEKGIAKEGDSHPIVIANRTFATLKWKKFGASATHATYSFMFHIYRQHMDFRDSRYPSMMQNLWKHCCQDGLVSGLALKSLRDSTSEQVFWKAIGGRDKYAKLGKTKVKDVSMEDLPKDWSRNVVPLKY